MSPAEPAGDHAEWPAAIEPQPASLRLLSAHLPPCQPPYPLGPLVAHIPTTMPQKGGCPQVTTPAGLTAVVPPGSAADSSPAPDGLTPSLGHPSDVEMDNESVDLGVEHAAWGSV